MAAASDDRKDQDADHVHRNRWKDLHEHHTTLRPWLPQPIVTSPLPAGSEMAARLNARVMGIETEYGISALSPGPSALPSGFGNAFVEDDLHPMQLSNHVVKAYGASAAGQPAGWDYETETPLRDIRGYEISRAAAHPDQLTDTDLGMANVILTNGARLYVDHAHPEYSSPEVTCALDAVRYDKAGEAVMAIAAQRATQSLGRSVRLYKNNTDGKGASLRHPRELPAAAQHTLRPDCDAVHGLSRLAAGDHRSRPSGRGAIQPDAGFPDQPTRGLLRG